MPRVGGGSVGSPDLFWYRMDFSPPGFLGFAFFWFRDPKIFPVEVGAPGVGFPVDPRRAWGVPALAVAFILAGGRPTVIIEPFSVFGYCGLLGVDIFAC